jgi:hypothetical protein
MYVTPGAQTIPGEGLPIPMSGCAPCAAAASMRGVGATFEDGTEKPSWWNYVPVVALGVIACAGVVVWRLGK